MIRRAPIRATSSRISARSRPEPNSASISAWILSVGDNRDGTGVVLPVQTLAVLYGTYARRHLHRGMDTAPRDCDCRLPAWRAHLVNGSIWADRGRTLSV